MGRSPCGLGPFHCGEEKGLNGMERLSNTSRGKSVFPMATGTSQGKEVRMCIEFGGHQLAGARLALRRVER